MTTTLDTPTLRWSSVRACPRKAIYEATGAPARERYDREERILFRGRRLGRDYADWIAAKYGEENIERERKVTWPLGTGHIDVYLKETRTAVEVLSSAHASDAMTRSKLLQLVGYMKHDDEVDNGVLIILDPSNFAEERVVVSTSSRLYAELEAECDERIAQVLAWRDNAILPGRVCGKPNDAYGHFCLHAEHCFEGWTAPPLEEITASEDVLAAVVELDTIKRQRKEVGGQDRSLESRQKELQEILETVDLPAGKFMVGPYQVNRSPRTRAGSFDWKKAEAAGELSDPLLAYLKPDTTYVVYDVEKVGVEEWGDEAPWTDADLNA